jgi:hypothetical protein
LDEIAEVGCGVLDEEVPIRGHSEG